MPPLPPRAFPSPQTRHPVILPDGSTYEGTVFLKTVVDHPRMEVGDYTYASAHVPPENWAFHLAPYLYPQSPERLVIGKFCQIADGVQFITASANHRYDGFSSFPFAIFEDMDRNRPSMPGAGRDTVIGHDVWLGQGARVLPGAQIGSGVIVGTGAVVGGVIPAYSVVSGNPGQVARRRFPDDVIAALLEIAWWDWPIEAISAAEAAICGGDLEALQATRPD